MYPVTSPRRHPTRHPLLLLLLVLGLSGTLLQSSEARPVRVLVWDEQQPQQKQAYPQFLGNAIAGHLRTVRNLEVHTATLSDPDQGLSPTTLATTDVLVWWGHVRQAEISTEKARDIVARIKSGQLGFLAIHSAHWSQPFVEAMAERARIDALATLPARERNTARLIETNLFSQFRTPPRYDMRRTPSSLYRKPPGGPVEIRLTLPNCCFPGYRADGKPSTVLTLLPAHPIARGLPAEWQIPQTEMYDEPFHVPAPDEVVFEERWATGEWFRSGAVWRLGQGRVFYFRPGHETYPVYLQEKPLKVIENAVQWLTPTGRRR